MPNAARITDTHTCPMVTGTVPHVGGLILFAGSPTVFINGVPAVRVGDNCLCVGPPDTVMAGSSSVKIENKPAARLGDLKVHGGTITSGSPTVIIGG